MSVIGEDCFIPTHVFSAKLNWFDILFQYSWNKFAKAVLVQLQRLDVESVKFGLVRNVSPF